MASKRKVVSELEDSQEGLSKRAVLPEILPRPPGSASIGSISDKELLSIFSRLPLCDLLHSVELVNQRWRWLALKCCFDRTSLSLLQAPAYINELFDITRYWFFTDYTTRVPFGWECIRVTKEVNSVGVKWLGARFPKVTQLVLNCVDHLSVERFVELTQMYPNLERFVLFSTLAQQIQYNQPQFWTALQGLQSLYHLYLPFEFGENPHPNQLAPILRNNIRTIYCKYRGLNHREITNVILDPEIIERIGLFLARDVVGGMFFFLEKTNEFLMNALQVPQTQFGIYPIYFADENISTQIALGKLDHAAVDTPMITHLDMAIPPNVALLPFLTNLSLLTRLIHIRFTEQRRDGQQPPSQFFSGLTPDNYRNQLGQPDHTLPSVRYLHLSKFDIIQPSSIFRYFSLIFPQIDTLHIEDCTLIDSTGTRTSSYWFLTNIRHFAQLRQVYHNNRLVLEMDRDKDGDYAEMDNLVRAITNEMFNQRP